MESRSVSEIFSQAPGNWGLRGDPYFWDDLRQHFREFSLPYPADKFADEVHRLFERETGTKLTRDCEAYIPKYNQGGMSSGLVCGAYWIEHGIPLLIKRLEEANKNHEPRPAIFSYEKQSRSAGIALVIISSLIMCIIGLTLAIFRTLPYLLILGLYLIIYVPILMLGIQQLRLHHGSIEVFDNCIKYKSRDSCRTIPFWQMERITFSSGLFQTMNLHTSDGQIRIGKKIQDYQKLYMMLVDKVPKLKEIPEGPVIIRHDIFTTFGTSLVMVIMFCALAYMSANGYINGRTPLAMAPFLGGIGVFFAIYIVASALTSPYKYRLDHDGITEITVLKSKLYPKNSIKAIRYGQIRALYHTRLKHYRMVNYIRFDFSGMPPLSIYDINTNYPIEHIVLYAKKAFYITSDYLNIEKQ